MNLRKLTGQQCPGLHFFPDQKMDALENHCNGCLTQIQPVASGKAEKIHDNGVDPPDFIPHDPGNVSKLLLIFPAFSRRKLPLEPLSRHADGIERVADFVRHSGPEL